MLVSPIIEQPYDVKSYNLLQLKNRILKDYDYSRMDVVRGFVNHGDYTLHYDFSGLDLTISDEDKNKLNQIHTDAVKELYEILEDSYKQNCHLYSEFQKEIQKDVPDFTLVAIEKQHEQHYTSDWSGFLNRNYHLKWNDAEALSDKIRNFVKEHKPDALVIPDKYKPYMDLDSWFGVSVEALLGAIIYCKIKDAGLDSKYLIDTHFGFNKVNTDTEYLPSRFNPNNPETVKDNFVIRDVHYKAEVPETEIPKNMKMRSYIPYITYVRQSDLSIKFYPIFADAKQYYEQAVAEAIDDVKLDNKTFNTMVDSMPIVVNKNTSTGKYELIDGYKRVLVNNNSEQLNKSVAVKVFNDLSDGDFLHLLFALNEWKTIAKEWLYDRGYMFALRERFGIKIEDYPILSKYDKADFSLYNILKLYGEDSSRVPEQYADDILQMKGLQELYDNTTSILNKEFKDRVFIHLIQLLGTARRKDVTSPKIDVIETFERIVNDPDLVKLLNKKAKLQMSSYIDGYWSEQKVDDYLMSSITDTFDVANTRTISM